MIQKGCSLIFQISLLISIHMLAQASYYHGPKGPKNESFECAIDRFDRMTVRQMQHVCVNDFTPNQQEAFKELATDYFMSEVIRPGCASQSRRRKYEVMYAKIGQMNHLPDCRICQ